MTHKNLGLFTEDDIRKIDVNVKASRSFDVAGNSAAGAAASGPFVAAVWYGTAKALAAASV